EFSGIYPQTTPGGWRVLGHTDSILFDPARASPALLTPGDKVHFRPVA
ncbi:MAG TPA: carboxyltransferase domain-containing protein, partial [Gammaproteobacteria bacterium]|nr:carboxyltransferase domain-containing protein [Gammaproteobacteria bacterium]